MGDYLYLFRRYFNKALYKLQRLEQFFLGYGRIKILDVIFYEYTSFFLFSIPWIQDTLISSVPFISLNRNT